MQPNQETGSLIVRSFKKMERSIMFSESDQDLGDEIRGHISPLRVPLQVRENAARIIHSACARIGVPE
ncbi:MAG TPA: hypothetical protein VNL98_12365 [Gemmatimonadales bacterium]|nr:hypothetical protein [Gemmatimonadales bacterium]